MSEQAITPVDQANQWARTVFRPFNLQWHLAQPMPRVPGVHLRGSANGAMVDTVTLAGRVKLISMAVRLAPESTILMVHVLACIREEATQKDANTWLARTLDMLPRDRPGVRVRPWGAWSVEITSTAIGLVTMIVKPRRI